MAFLRTISSSTAEDSELLQQYKLTGDINILAVLYQRYMDLAYGVCIKYLEDPEDAKDAVMDVFEELRRKLDKHEVTNFRSWLYTVVKNHCLMRLRSGSKQKSTVLDENRMQLHEESHLDAVNEREWQFQQLTKCIESLGSEQKASIELFYLQEKCYKDISTITGLDLNRVRSLIQNGRRNLKICMDQTAGSNGVEAAQNIKSSAKKIKSERNE